MISRGHPIYHFYLDQAFPALPATSCNPASRLNLALALLFSRVPLYTRSKRCRSTSNPLLYLACLWGWRAVVPPHYILTIYYRPHWTTAYRATIWYSTPNSTSFDYRNTFHIENRELRWCKLVCTFLNRLSLWKSINNLPPRMLAGSITEAVEKLFLGISLEHIARNDTRLNDICRNWSDFSNDLLPLACLNPDARVMVCVKTRVVVRLKSFWHASLTLYRFYCLPAYGIYILQQL